MLPGPLFLSASPADKSKGFAGAFLGVLLSWLNQAPGYGVKISEYCAADPGPSLCPPLPAGGVLILRKFLRRGVPVCLLVGGRDLLAPLPGSCGSGSRFSRIISARPARIKRGGPAEYKKHIITYTVFVLAGIERFFLFIGNASKSQ